MKKIFISSVITLVLILGVLYFPLILGKPSFAARQEYSSVIVYDDTTLGSGFIVDDLIITSYDVVEYKGSVKVKYNNLLGTSNRAIVVWANRATGIAILKPKRIPIVPVRRLHLEDLASPCCGDFPVDSYDQFTGWANDYYRLSLLKASFGLMVEGKRHEFLYDGNLCLLYDTENMGSSSLGAFLMSEHGGGMVLRNYAGKIFLLPSQIIQQKIVEYEFYDQNE